MWSLQEIESLLPTSVQKRLPFTYSATDISNFIGNLSITPEIIPTTLRNKFLIQAIVRETIIAKRTSEPSQECVVPQEIMKYATTPEEAILMTIDSIIFPDFCTIKQEGIEKPLCTVVQIHSIEKKLHGICVCDFGLTEKQTIHLESQKLIRIPVPQTHVLKIILTLSVGNSSVKQNIPIEIPNSMFGLMIDTRDPDILISSSLVQAKALVSSWFDTLDIPYVGV